MRDPLDRWAEGETSVAFPGDQHGHGVRQEGPPGAVYSDRDVYDTGEFAVGDPVSVTGPTRRYPGQGYPEPQHSGWDQPEWDRPGPVPPGGDVIPGEAVARRPAYPVPYPDEPGPEPVPHPAHGAPAGPPGGPGDTGGFSSRFGPDTPREERIPRRRPLRRAVVVLLVTVLAASGGTFAWAETSLKRNVDLDKYDKRPPPGEGTNYLIVGSDSREGLSEEDRQKLNTGVFGGRRTDSMILLHKGRNGTTMVSFPRDSWVTLPGYTHPSTGKRSKPVKNKLNAAFSQGGPELLISTIEQNTGLHIDHYAEIGFAGFVNIVDSVGGVPMCLKRDIRDRDSGANLRRGCQTLDGAQALAFVRQRHQEAQGDLGRTQNQQRFLSALAKKASQPDVMLDPTHVYPALGAGLDTLVVDKGMSLKSLTSMFRSLQGVSKGGGKQLNVPTAGPIRTRRGDAVRWNEAQAEKLFEQLKRDRPVTVK